jgi:hypothetical protein
MSQKHLSKKKKKRCKCVHQQPYYECQLKELAVAIDKPIKGYLTRSNLVNNNTTRRRKHT